MIDMFEQWGTQEWVLLVFELIAIGLILWFLVWKIRSKLNEVETRHQFVTQRRLDEKNIEQRNHPPN